MDKLFLADSAFVKSFITAVAKTIAIRRFGRLKSETNVYLAEAQPIYHPAYKQIARLDLDSIPIPPQDLSNIPIPPIELRSSFTIQAPKTYIIQAGEYGKLTSLLEDNSISVIECGGADKEIIIVKAGEKQATKISLSEDEIKELIRKIAFKAKIPQTEGVFKAQVDNFEINAVISEVIGTRFILRKQTPYNLIEPKPASIALTI
jgi:hypothetical protein